MSVYRFKVTFEDNEEIYREIEIKSIQTFEDFHFIILNSIGFDTIHNASFFISDDYWRKGEEITYKPDEVETEKRKKKNLPPLRTMNKCRMVSLIDDPHQKFVYIYDPKVQWTFLIELSKITPDDDKIKYPRITKSIEDAPKQYIIQNVPVANPEDDFDDDDDDIKDDDAYKLTHDDDDLGSLEGEEGEELDEDLDIESEEDEHLEGDEHSSEEYE